MISALGFTEEPREAAAGVGSVGMATSLRGRGDGGVMGGGVISHRSVQVAQMKAR